MATQVTHTELSNLITNGELTPGEIYVITDYPTCNLSATAIDEYTLDDCFYNYSARDSRVYHYVPETNTVDYLVDKEYLIEGNFDWTENITGKCYDIHFENAVNLILQNCTGIYCEDTAEGGIKNGQYIVLGDGCTVDINGCQYLTIGRDNDLTITGSSAIDIGDRNTLVLNKLDCCSIEHDNSDLNIQGRNIIGSSCTAVTINGDSNIIQNKSVDITIQGDCNTVKESLYITNNGDFNTMEKVSLAQLNVACGNEIANAGQLTVDYTNNNVVLTDEIFIDHKEPFVQYQRYGGIKKVKDLRADINMRADSNATVLLVDEQKMWMTPSTKDNKHYVVIDGEWVDVENQ